MLRQDGFTPPSTWRVDAGALSNCCDCACRRHQRCQLLGTASSIASGAGSTRVGGGRSGGPTAELKPLFCAHSSIRSNNLPILRSERAHMLRNDPENCALPFSLIPARRPTSFTPIAVRALMSSVDRSGVPASCSEASQCCRPRHSAHRAHRRHPSTTPSPCRGKRAALECAHPPTR